ncbi:MAG: energy-coupling factor transporter ATPase [bacterium]
MIRLARLSHTYQHGTSGEINALQEVDLTIGECEFVAIIGPNGCGKSTLARHLNALLLPTGGDVWVEGLNTREPENIVEIRRRVGMVFQNPETQIVATMVEEDVAFGPENLGLSPEEIRKRVKEALQAVSLEGFELLSPHQLSGGQKQRVALAGILAMRPRTIVLDEPTAMLDPAGRREVFQAVSRLNTEEGIRVVYITHFMEEAVEARRVIVLDRGTIVMDGTSAEVFSQYDRMAELGVGVPCITRLDHALREKGFNLPKVPLSAEEMADELSLLPLKASLR